MALIARKGIIIIHAIESIKSSIEAELFENTYVQLNFRK